MFYFLGQGLSHFFTFFNVFHYISFRSIVALLSSFFMGLLLGKRFIRFSSQAFENTARAFTPENHQKKGSTPTMGGVLIIILTALNTFLWADLRAFQIWILLATLTLFGAIGLWDDVSKVMFKKGISAKLKFRLQLVCALIVALCWILLQAPTAEIFMPIFKGFAIPLGILFVPWLLFVIIGTSNAVNLTDGLDGLAVGVLLINYVFFGGLLYITGHAEFASYLHLEYMGTGEAVVFVASLIGACLSFFWFNAYPAEIFMGDVGSLSLGATLGVMAIMTRQEMLLAIVGGIFVAETLSVILQIASVKLFGRRIFKMAPLHHHFEIIGIKESKVTTRFHIVTLILSLFAAICLKLR